MKGYHYTSLENWEKIKKEGLKPYPINHPDILKIIPETIYGIFTWIKNPQKMSHIGNIIFQFSTKRSFRIVKLSFNYSEEDIFLFENQRVKVSHYGEITGYQGGELPGVGSDYHTGEKAWIITRLIPPKEIKLEGEYNLLSLLK